MKGEQAVYRRVLRRETHSPRTHAAVVVASILLVALVAAIASGVWWLAEPGFRDVVADRSAALSSLADDRSVLMATGAVTLLIAAMLTALAVLPGRLPRRGRAAGRLALLVDDGVLADVIADAVATACGISRTQVSATVGRRKATVRVTPTSGMAVDRAAATESAVAALAAVGFPLTPKVLVAREGVVA